MDKDQVLACIKKTGIIAIVRGTKEEEIISLAQALYAGGIKAIEVTCNTPGYLEMIRTLVGTLGDKMTIGAGTVLSPAAAQMVMDAGASFVLAPDLNPAVVQLVHQNQKLAIPGVTTPTEVMSAYRLGVDVVKLFPAGPLGAAYVKNLRGPFHNLAIIAVGGINLANIGGFVEAGAVAFGIGGELIDKQALATGNYAAITEKAQKFMAIVKKNGAIAVQ